MCNKICGGAHYKMKLMVVVLSPKAYKKWYATVSYKGSNKDKVATSKLFKTSYALNKPADAPAATATDSTAVPGMDSPAGISPVQPGMQP
jgi:heme/copper-type cytochrome/quinol oxidase subunit 2